MTELPKEIFSKILTYIDYREIRKVATEVVKEFIGKYLIYDCRWMGIERERRRRWRDLNMAWRIDDTDKYDLDLQ